MKPAAALPTRRQAIAYGIAAAAAGFFHAQYLFAEGPAEKFSAALKALEIKSGGRLGVALLDASTGKQFGHRLDERFAMCSTFKFLAASFVLHRVDTGQEDLNRKIIIAAKPTLPNSPVTALHVGDQGITVAELCAAAVDASDNTAANLLLASFGGPAKLTAYLRASGDTVTRLDRTEPDLNTALHGDPRDTTSPAAMAATMRRHLLGNALSASSRETLTNWLLNCKTGDARIRAGLAVSPNARQWKIGDKTGTGFTGSGTSNDIAIIWPTNHAPVLVTAFLTESPLSPTERDATIAQVGKLTADFLQST